MQAHGTNSNITGNISNLNPDDLNREIKDNTLKILKKIENYDNYDILYENEQDRLMQDREKIAISLNLIK